MEVVLKDGTDSHIVKIEQRGHVLSAVVDGEHIEGDICAFSSNGLSFCIEGRSTRVWYAKENDEVYVHCDGRVFSFSFGRDASGIHEDSRSVSVSGAMITAPMPGSVLKICAKEGEHVEEGTCLAILEAMKMETELYANAAGTVKRLFVRSGDQVDAGQPIVEMDSETNNAEK